MTDKIRIMLSEQEIAIIATALAELPYRISAPVIYQINTQMEQRERVRREVEQQPAASDADKGAGEPAGADPGTLAATA